MKTFYTTILAFLFTFTAFAQEGVYQENFDSNDNNNLPAGFMSENGNWSIERTLSAQSNSRGSYLVAIKNDNSQVKLTFGGENFNRMIAASVTGSITISWEENKSSGYGSSINSNPTTFSYSVDGGARYIKVNESKLATTTPLQDGWRRVTITLPVETTYTNNLQFAWEPTGIGNDAYSFDNFNVEAMQVNVMPVELVYFKGQVQNGSAKLTWSTASEKNNEKFLVEHSQDATSFRKIGEVKGNGTSATVLNYNYSDLAPAKGTNYYRLRQIDTDGTEAFSKVIALEFASNSIVSGATVYPTVTSEVININLGTMENATINIVDASGKPVATMANVAEREVAVPIQSLKKGVYFVTVVNSQSHETKRFIKN